MTNACITDDVKKQDVKGEETSMPELQEHPCPEGKNLQRDNWYAHHQAFNAGDRPTIRPRVEHDIHLVVQTPVILQRATHTCQVDCRC